MKTIITKLLSIILAAMVLYSTTSYAVNMHFCCNELVDMAVIGNATPCEDKAQENSDESSKKCSLGEKDCCNDVTFVKEGDDTLKKASFDLEEETLVFVNVYYYSYLNLFEGLKENIVPFDDYTPPLISKDVLVLHETFLI